jgi:hypothetical protein
LDLRCFFDFLDLRLPPVTVVVVVVGLEFAGLVVVLPALGLPYVNEFQNDFIVSNISYNIHILQNKLI